jgi:precorrin-8X/cobalt-precorrin-8 methylmutase
LPLFPQLPGTPTVTHSNRQNQIFDELTVIDWSSASRPVVGKDSIWIVSKISGRTCLSNPPTRAQAGKEIDSVIRATNVNHSRLIAIDVSLGLPSPFEEIIGASGTSWRDTWNLVNSKVSDTADNSNNRFLAGSSLNALLGQGPGPFWGHPNGRTYADLHATRPNFPWGNRNIPEFRLCEQLMRSKKLAIQSTWKLAYPGSVGGQFLMAVPWITALKERHPHIKIWPFETGFGTRPKNGDIWVAEIWPSEFPRLFQHEVKDADQVVSVLSYLSECNSSGVMKALLHGPVDLLSAEIAQRVEGWPISPALSELE